MVIRQPALPDVDLHPVEDWAVGEIATEGLTSHLAACLLALSLDIYEIGTYLKIAGGRKSLGKVL